MVAMASAPWLVRTTLASAKQRVKVNEKVKVRGSKPGNDRDYGVFMNVVSGQRVPFRTLMNGPCCHRHRRVLWKVSTDKKDGKDTVI